MPCIWWWRKVILMVTCQGVKAQVTSIKTVYILFTNIPPGNMAQCMHWNHSLMFSLTINLVMKKPFQISSIGQWKSWWMGLVELLISFNTLRCNILRTIIICVYTPYWVFPHILHLKGAPFWSVLLNDIKSHQLVHLCMAWRVSLSPCCKYGARESEAVWHHYLEILKIARGLRDRHELGLNYDSSFSLQWSNQ